MGIQSHLFELLTQTKNSTDVNTLIKTYIYK
jgi:hypothetical protein